MGDYAMARKKRPNNWTQPATHAEPLRRALAGPHHPADAAPLSDEALRASGEPLDTQIRALMEPRFGHDFGQVRVHTDPRAADSAAALRALAYTVGQDVVFGAGQYAPDAGAGQRLIAHELAHVAQYDLGAPAGSFERHALSQADGVAEREADAAASQAIAGSPVQVQASPDASVAREPEEKDNENKEIGELFESITRTLNTELKGLKLTSFNPEALEHAEHMGIGIESVGDFFSRRARGEGVAQSAGGGGLTALVGGLLEGEGSKDALKAVKGNEGLSNGLGFAGSALKFIGALTGEKEGPNIGLGDVGTYLDTASQFANPEELAKQGIKEGIGDLYTTSWNLADWARTGKSDKLIAQNRSQLMNGSNPITQGYSAIANVIGAGITGDTSELDDYVDAAQEGKAGPLAKLGVKIGDLAFDTTHQYIPHAIDWLGDKASGAGSWLADKWSGAEDWVSDTAGGVEDWVSDKVGGAEDWVSDKASDAEDWLADKAGSVGDLITGLF